MQRTPERDLIPMAHHFGLSLTQWAPLAGGALTGKYLKGIKGRLPDTSQRLNVQNTKIVETVVQIANENGCSPGNVALSWNRQSSYLNIPVIGATKLDQLLDNLKCLEVNLSPEQIVRLNEVSKIELGFPHDFLLSENTREVIYGGFDNKILLT